MYTKIITGICFIVVCFGCFLVGRCTKEAGDIKRVVYDRKFSFPTKEDYQRIRDYDTKLKERIKRIKGLEQQASEDQRRIGEYQRIIKELHEKERERIDRIGVGVEQAEGITDKLRKENEGIAAGVDRIRAILED